jgi:hypothetical protein
VEVSASLAVDPQGHPPGLSGVVSTFPVSCTQEKRWTRARAQPAHVGRLLRGDLFSSRRSTSRCHQHPHRPGKQGPPLPGLRRDQDEKGRHPFSRCDRRAQHPPGAQTCAGDRIRDITLRGRNAEKMIRVQRMETLGTLAGGIAAGDGVRAAGGCRRDDRKMLRNTAWPSSSAPVSAVAWYRRKPAGWAVMAFSETRGVERPSADRARGGEGHPPRNPAGSKKRTGHG